MVKFFICSVFPFCNKMPRRYLRQALRRFLVWLPLWFLAACAAPPATESPATAAPGIAIPPTTVPVAPAAPRAAAKLPAAPDPAAVSALRAWVEQHDRLNAVAAPLLLNNTALCKRDARYLLGITAKTKYSYSAQYVSAAQAAFGLGERLRVMNVLPGSGAAASGMQRGDILLAIENKTLPQGPHAERDAANRVGSTMKGRTSLNFTVLRGGQRMAIDVPLTRACAFGIELGDSDDVNSYADGHRALITRGMLRFTQSDEELAYALAKEMAHDILAQTRRPRMAAVIDALRRLHASAPGTRGTARIKPYTPVLDATADKLSLYLLARAGYRIDHAPAFWTRLANDYPATVPNSHTALHPATAYRLSVMKAVTQAIQAKQAHHLPLVP